MNQWVPGNDQYHVNNMIHGRGKSHKSNNKPHPGGGLLPPPSFLLPEMEMTINPAPPINPNFIGPVQPDNFTNEDMNMSDDDKDVKGDDRRGEQNRERDNRRERERDNRDKNRPGRPRDDPKDRSNDRNRGRNDRNRDRNDRNHDRNDGRTRDRRDRRSKWDNSQDTHNPGIDMPGMPSNMIPGMSGNMMPGVQMPGMPMGSGMQGGPNMPGVPMGSGPGMPGQGMGPGMMMPGRSQMMQNFNQFNQPNMGNMPNMMPGMNMMGNMMDQNMMMMNQQTMTNQPFYCSDCILLPPLPDVETPNRRERPPGCRTIFIGGLPRGTSEGTIQEIFQQFGTITDIKIHNQGVCHVRFESQSSVENSFFVSGYRFRTQDQNDNECTTLFIDYALNRDDQNEYERSQKGRPKPPPRVEPYSPATLATIGDKIKNDEQFVKAAPTLVAWLERGECNKKNSNTFYSLIQASNNQVRKLFTEKMSLDEEFHSTRATFKEKFISVVEQFEAVAKILSAAKHQRVSDHFTKQQRRNIDMWFKMSEEVENIKEEVNLLFDEDELEKVGRNVVSLEKFEQLKAENDNLIYELEGYKNEAYLAKDEAERKFETFKAHFIAQQALENKRQPYPPLPPPPNVLVVPPLAKNKPQPPPPTPDDDKVFTTGPAVPPTEAKLIAIITAFLMVHPLGASLDYLVSYVRSMVPSVTTATVLQVLQKYTDVFVKNTSGIGANIEHRWGFISFENIKSEAN